MEQMPIATLIPEEQYGPDYVRLVLDGPGKYI